MIHTVNESISSAKEVNVLGCQQYFVDTYSTEVEQYSRAQQHYNVLAQFPRVALETGAVAGMVIFALFAMLGGTFGPNLFAVLAVFSIADGSPRAECYKDTAVMERNKLLSSVDRRHCRWIVRSKFGGRQCGSQEIFSYFESASSRVARRFNQVFRLSNESAFHSSRRRSDDPQGTDCGANWAVRLWEDYACRSYPWPLP